MLRGIKQESMAPDQLFDYFGKRRVFTNGAKPLPDLKKFAYTEDEEDELVPQRRKRKVTKISKQEMSPPPPTFRSKRGAGNNTSTAGRGARSQAEAFDEASSHNKAKPSASSTKSRQTARFQNQNKAVNPQKDSGSAQLDQASTSSLKRAIDVVDISSEDDSDAGEEDESVLSIKSNKRVRSVAAPTRMGAKVSALVQGYENNDDKAVASHQQPTFASNAKRTVNSTSSNTSLNDANGSSRPSRIPAAARLQPNPSTSSLSMPLMPPPPPRRVARKRYFQCHGCKIMTPYDFDKHMSETLRCGNPGCRHRCCAECVVDSVGEVCEEQTWHEHENGYWGWRRKRVGETEEMTAH